MRNKLIIALSMVLTLGISGVAHADTTTITNTGAGSNNSATFTNNVSHVETNVNNVPATNVNEQTGATGSADVDNNTSAGGAVSGSVTNSNSSTTSISINNVGGSGGGSNPVTPAGGSGSSAAPASSQQTLPRTGGNSGLDMTLLNALMNARQGVIGPLVKAGADWNWALTALAGMLALAVTYGYSKIQTRKFTPATSQVI